MDGNRQKLVLAFHGGFAEGGDPEVRRLLADSGWTVLHCPSEDAWGKIRDRRLPELEAVLSSGERWDREALERAPRLRIISRVGSGCDNIDLAAARARGIDVTNARVPELSVSVAELALGLILSALRRLPDRAGETRRGLWRGSGGGLLSGRTVGLLGYGAIARALASLLAGFGTRLLAFDAAPDREAAARQGVALLGRDRVLAESDVVSLHLPLTPATRRCMDRRAFALMKPGSLLVNTARGGLVDEEALARALREDRPGFAAVDVMDPEPPDPAHPLLAMDRFMAVPHLGGNTGEAGAAIVRRAAENLLACDAGRRPEGLVNP